MRLSITGRLVAMFAATTLIAFGLVGAALYQVLASELDRHQLEELRTDLQNLQYSIERTGTLDRWARVQTKMDTLTPTDGRVRFWVVSDDPRFQYGKGLSALRDLRRRDFYEVLLEEQGAAVDIEGDVGAEAPIDRALVRRALSNLLQNAIEHAEPRSRIVIDIRRLADEVWVCVSNRGQPLAEAQLLRLFDRFYRVDAARNVRGRPHGHGLGLAIVKAVATMHGGDVRATSEDGTTTIGFSVPVGHAGEASGTDLQAADARLVTG